MTDLKPWIDDGAPDGVRELLAAARAEEPGGAGAERALVALGVGSAAIAATTHAAAGTLATAAAGTAGAGAGGAVVVGGVGFVVKWGLIGALGAVTTFGVAHVGIATLTTDTATGATDRGASRVAPAPRAGESSGQDGVSTVRSEVPPGSGPPAAGAVAGAAAGKTTRGTLPSDAPTPGFSGSSGEPTELLRGSDGEMDPAPAPRVEETIESRRMLEEVAAVDRARSLLARGDALGALGALDVYGARFPEQRFAPEALYLRMEASGRAGDAPGARASAVRLLQLFPTSPQAARARAVLASAR